MIARITIAQGYAVIGVGIALGCLFLAIGLLAIADAIRNRY